MMIEISYENKTDEELYQDLVDLGNSITLVRKDEDTKCPSNYMMKTLYYKYAYDIVDELKKRESIIPLPTWIEEEMAYQEKLSKAKAYELCLSINREYELYQTVVSRKYVHVIKELHGKETYHSIPKEEFLNVIKNLHLYDWESRFYNPNALDEEVWFVNVGYTYDHKEKLYGMNVFPSGFHYLLNCLREWTIKENVK